MARGPLIWFVIAGVFVVGLLLPASPWVGWVGLAVMCAGGLWLFIDAAGVLSMRQRLLALARLGISGVMILVMTVWPRHALPVVLVAIVLQLAMGTMKPTARPPLR